MSLTTPDQEDDRGGVQGKTETVRGERELSCDELIKYSPVCGGRRGTLSFVSNDGHHQIIPDGMFHLPKGVHISLVSVGVQVSILLYLRTRGENSHDLRGKVVELGPWDDRTPPLIVTNR